MAHGTTQILKGIVSCIQDQKLEDAVLLILYADGKRAKNQDEVLLVLNIALIATGHQICTAKDLQVMLDNIKAQGLIKHE